MLANPQIHHLFRPIPPPTINHDNPISKTPPHKPSNIIYFAANLDLALNLAPKKYNTYTPTLHPTVNPASRLTPLFTPKL